MADRPLLRYRQHGGNQTGILTGIVTKQDYVNRYLGEFLTHVSELSGRVQTERLVEASAWGEARQANAEGQKGAFRRLFALGSVNPSTTLFELFALRLPEPLFRLAVRIIRSGKI